MFFAAVIRRCIDVNKMLSSQEKVNFVKEGNLLRAIFEKKQQIINDCCKDCNIAVDLKDFAFAVEFTATQNPDFLNPLFSQNHTLNISLIFNDILLSVIL